MSGATAMRVATITAGVPFVDALAAGVLAMVSKDGARDPLALARVTVLLPTRRAIRSLREAFLRQSNGVPLLLPRLLPLGELDDDAFLLEAEGASSVAADLPPAISGLRRQLLLAQLVRKLGLSLPVQPDEAQAARLAQALAGLLDQVQTERLDFAALKTLAPERYAAHWQQTLAFLTILTEHWPKILEAEGCLDPAERRNRLLETQAALWRDHPPSDLVIAAGSTGSIPATADLLATVAGLPNGWVVLPGLDRRMSENCWRELPQSHPQYGLARLLTHFKLTRDDVTDWPVATIAEVAAPARIALIGAALDPFPEEGEIPSLVGHDPDTQLAGVSRIDASGPHEEAAIVALMMREAAEAPGRTAALVTPDRDLASRVAAELRRWNIEVDDSAGRPLAAMPVGAFLRLSLAMLAEKLAPVPLLAAFKHPLAGGGIEPAAFRGLTRALERAVLRGPRPGEGFAGLRAILTAHPRLDGWLARLEHDAEPLCTLLDAPAVPLEDIMKAHVAWAEKLAASHEADGAARLWRGDDGEAMANFIAELASAARGLPPMAGAAYPALFDALLSGRVVRPRYGAHPRLFIWGPLEARLQHADLMILGGLNEGTWPPDVAADPWMSRPMRADFGLPLPERRIGLSAHDFVQACAAPRVVLSRARRVQGTPTVPSRWLQRLDNLLLALGKPAALDRGHRWTEWQQALDRPERVTPIERPAPTPPLAARPRRLSVTAIGTWMRDPYAIYARAVLGLKALDPLDADPGAAERGTFIHDALDRFLRGAPVGETPDAAYRRLVEIGRDCFGPALSRPGVWAFWWPRFLRIARWVVDVQEQRRGSATPLAVEGWGKLMLDMPSGPFELIAKADRIDSLIGGRLAVIDYKTGSPPQPAHMESGHEPQLPLEAAMAARGGFDGVPPTEVGELAVWRLSGGATAGEIKRFDAPTRLADEAYAGLLRLIAAYDDPATPYPARPRADMAPRYSDYEHLARVKEWSAGVDDSMGEE